MALVKTEPGRGALQKRDRTLSPRERQILVIADGSRSRGQMVALLGPAAANPIDRLLQLGFLASHEPMPVAAPAHPAEPTTAPAHQRHEGRRSLVAAKMYCIDMLKLIREPEAASLVRAIQTSASERELMDNMLLCLRYLHVNTAGSYAAKVTARLAEIVPLPHLASFAEWREEGVADAATVDVLAAHH